MKEFFAIVAICLGALAGPCLAECVYYPESPAFGPDVPRSYGVQRRPKPGEEIYKASPRVSLLGKASDGYFHRSWWAFRIPQLPGPVVRAELWIQARGMWLFDNSIRLQLRDLRNGFDALRGAHPSPQEAFEDLGDGELFGEAIIRTEDAASSLYNSSRDFAITLKDAAVNSIVAAQNSDWVVGGALAKVEPIPSEDGATDAEAFLSPEGVRLVLYVDSATPPQAEITYWSSRNLVAGDYLALAGHACAPNKLEVQWLINGAPLPGATNLLLRIPSVTLAHSGKYQLRVNAPAGPVESEPIAVQVAPFEVSSPLLGRSAYLGLPITLDIHVRSNLRMSYRWRKDGVEIPGATGPHLTLGNAQTGDAGTYEVALANAAGNRTVPAAVLTIIGWVPLEKIPVGGLPDAIAGFGYSLGSDVQGQYPLNYQWYKNREPIPGATDQTLSFEKVAMQDAGAYQVEGMHGARALRGVIRNLNVLPMRLINGGAGGDNIIGAPHYFQVLHESASPVSVQWYQDDAALQGATNLHLFIPSKTTNDSGIYSVVARNAFGAVTNKFDRIEVTAYPPVITSASASPPQPVVGWGLELQAQVAASPAPQLQWLRDGIPIDGGTNRLLRLVVSSANDSGKYTLLAINPLGRAESEPIPVAVQPFQPWGPRISASHVRLYAREGTALEVESFAGGSAPLTLQWHHEGKPLLGATESTLFLTDVTREHSGSFELLAANELGAVRSNLVNLTVTPATALDRWIWRAPQPQGSRIEFIVYGNNRYVAAGKGGNVLASVDGRTWVNKILPGEIDDVYVLKFENGRFVMNASARYGPETMMTSFDGLDWHYAGNHVGSVLQVGFGDGRFNAASSGVFPSATSPEWTRDRLTSEFAFPPHSIIWGDNRYLAMNGGLFESPDGRNWKRIEEVVGRSAALGWIGFAQGRFFVPVTDGVRFVSDGDSGWTLANTPFSSHDGIIGGNGVWVVPAEGPPNGHVWFSPDALNWTRVDTGAGQELSSIVFAQGRFTAVGGGGAIITSVDGKNWSRDLAENDLDYFGVAHGMGRTVVAGEEGTILTSEDAVHWTKRPTPAKRYLRDVHFSAGIFVAVGNGGAIFTSSDGINWARRESGTEADLRRVSASDGRWIAVGENTIVDSFDGFHWERLEPANIPCQTCTPIEHEGLAHGRGVWVVVGGYFDNDTSDQIGAVPTIKISRDGREWSDPPAGMPYLQDGKRLRDVAFGNNLFVAVGNDGLVLTSREGFQWRVGMPMRTGENLRRINFLQGRFVAIGNEGEIHSSPSPDTQPWVRHFSANSQNLHDIDLRDDGTLIMVGNNGMILQSLPVTPGFLSFSASPEAVHLEVHVGLHPNGAALEASSNLADWETLLARRASDLGKSL